MKINNRPNPLAHYPNDTNYIAGPDETDLDGKPRIFDGRIDMGAYEHGTAIPAEARILPRTINLASKGKWITSYIWLPEAFDVADIERNSVLFNGVIRSQPVQIDEDQQVAIARFDRCLLWTIESVGPSAKTLQIKKFLTLSVC